MGSAQTVGANFTQSSVNTCSATFPAGTSVTLTATPNSGYTFSGWTGACSGTGACTVTMNSNQNVGASFSQAAPSDYLVTVNNLNFVGGSIISNSGKINCGSLCSGTYSSGTSEILFASANAGYTFAGWTGDCFLSGTGPCTLNINTNKIVGANFTQNAPSNYTISVTNLNQAGGTVNSNTGKINCGSLCTGTYSSGSIETLTAAPKPGYSFTGWGGACSGTGSCLLTVSANQSVTANFAISTYPLTISKVGNGTVTSTPVAINCGTTCSANFNSGTLVTLSATPAAGYSFTGWSGACTGLTSCSVTMDSIKVVGATFTTLPVLTVTKTGNGSVVSNPAGINCGASCASSFNQGAFVSLSATPDAGYYFSGWTGACTGTGACSVAMNSNQSIGATFIALPVLSVTKVGNGNVQSTPAGINCGPSCSSPYSLGANVSLTVTPDPGYKFFGWSGACTGSSSCSVTMSSNQNVTATFEKLPDVFWTLKVTKPSLGVITSEAAKISCGGKLKQCSGSVQQGSVLTLTATPKAGYYTKSWKGCTSAVGDTCTVLVGNKNMTISAAFSKSKK